MKVDKEGNFIIDNYQKNRTFSSFLPGIAGKLGVPMWAFYVNRGQGIASFGIENKDKSMMEFQPANKSYQTVSTRGFRTFIKYKNENDIVKLYEPFSGDGSLIKNKMIIAPHALTIKEINEECELEVIIRYFILPNENFGSLVRRVSLRNLAEKNREVEILDGLPEIIPYGLSNSELKEVSQTMAAWCRVYNLENNTPFYRLKASTSDSPEVRKMKKGHFFISFSGENQILAPLVDRRVIFGQNTALKIPEKFMKKNIFLCQDEQLTENQIPAAMAFYKTQVDSNSEININSLFGHLKNQEKLMDIKERVLDNHYLDKKEKESKKIHKELTDNIFTKSSLPIFDNYCNQTFLDNVIRGGFPINLGQKNSSQTYHIYSRKHGDLERDYNFFHLEASFYSQGNGNYRDINQNRRCDNFFNPQVKDHNIKTFVNLIQADGYNPLVIKGNKNYLAPGAKEKVLKFIDGKSRELISKRLNQPFTAGELSSFINSHDIKIKIELNKFIDKVIGLSNSTIDAEFGEGYWIDHWTYLLDLIENYLIIYPEKVNELFFADDSYYFYDSYMKVKPRQEKYVLTESGPRQLNALVEEKEKKKLINGRKEKPYHVRTRNGRGGIYRTTLFVKLLSLITNKISTMDPRGIGIEMEANKPGWYDALNGLPGIFGSSTPETMELKRLVDYLLAVVETEDSSYKLVLPVEIYNFIRSINEELKSWLKKQDNYDYWNESAYIKEKYREEVFYGFSGKEKELSISYVKSYLNRIAKKLQNSINSAAETDYNLYSTYYYYLPVEYEKTGEVSETGYPYIEVNKFKQVKLPPFLEGQVRAMKILQPEEAKDLHMRVKDSELFDKKLKMYRLNGDLSNMPADIGRARAFTEGWLENGSIWLHMEYKYLLELIKNKQYDLFFQALDNCLIPFQNPEVYGRSILENSSFIMSSSNPDERNHGRGYIARLSGSTAEFINIWTIMAFGYKPFKTKNGEPIFCPQPILKGDFFTCTEEEITIRDGEDRESFLIPKDSFACRLFGKTLVVYHNPARKDTFNSELIINNYRLVDMDGSIDNFEGAELNADCVREIREGRIKKIDINLTRR